MAVKITSEVEHRLKIATELGFAVDDIARTFRIATRTLVRLRKKWENEGYDDDIMSLASDGSKKIAVITPDNMSLADAKKQVTREIEMQIADKCIEKAKEILDVLDVSKLSEDRKAVTLGILIDKSRLIRGESTQNVAKQEIQFVAVKMLDELEKSKKRQEASPIVDIQADEKSDVENDSK